MEAFSWALLSLKGLNGKLNIERTRDNPPRSFLSDDEISSLNNNCTIADITRKGKLLCMALNCIKPIEVEGKKHKRVYLFLHMGMTGRISSPGNVPALKELSASNEYPPPHTYMTWSVVGSKQKVLAEASYSDPRKFGSVELAVDQNAFDQMAPDGLTLEEDGKTEDVIVALTKQSKPIKAILLDQKRAVSGVGNWVADEIMYQCKMHPEQKHLTRDEAESVVAKLASILKTAVDHLKRNEDFPDDWMFEYRWTKKRKEAKDSQGRVIAFVKSGGRTSAIVPTIQKLQGREKTPKKKAGAKADTTEDVEEPSQQKKIAAKRKTVKNGASKKEEEEKPNTKTRPKKATGVKEEEEEARKEPAQKRRAARSKSKAKPVPVSDNKDADEGGENKESASASKKNTGRKSSRNRSQTGDAEEGIPAVRKKAKADDDEEDPPQETSGRGGRNSTKRKVEVKMDTGSKDQEEPQAPSKKKMTSRQTAKETETIKQGERPRRSTRTRARS